MLISSKREDASEHRLSQRAGVASTLDMAPISEEAWIEVIQKMDAVYADLVHHQVELERKNAALEDAQQFIGGVLGAMTDVLIVCDRAGQIERVNAALERLTGKSEADMIGLPLAILFAQESRPVIERLAGKLNDSPPIADHEVALLDETGHATPLAMNCSARYDHRGNVQGFVLIGRPVGELRRAYESLNIAHSELRQAQRQLVVSEKMAAMGRLVAGVAHELNNPISFVFGNMHALKRYGERLTQYLQAIDEGGSPEELQVLRTRLKIDRVLADITPLVEGTLEGAERVSEIVQDLRRFSSTQSEAADTFDLARVVRTAVSWVVKAARTKPTVVFDMPETLDVVGRKGPVHQIIVNLVQNAVDVMADIEEPRLDISAHVKDGIAAVVVRDHGPGIAKDATARIFEPFFTTKKIGEGTGLGLYVSYGLAEELGGKLEAANHPDAGAVFTLRLSVKEAGHEG
ncbi:PAS/PAC sensor signal transduction histidine kinase [Hyphomicrobium denitrificans 1NES1]|uniref:histidine kinase n=1 Tax=Hyphomicrobium denitrificans 1NES1 TaxID=670307 RepID=N0B2X5_9HYPH|nr:ATP-binding protein [Hyphomicrobium denitrificans]AGK57353.1 PAS/PAC sensor signal transduction histidine kinase [Hyphomicrobium denitrificans 1NES1]